MLAFRKAFAQRLLAIAGGLVGGRVYYQFPPRPPTLPCVSYFVVSDVSSVETLPNSVLIQVDIWGDDDVELETICDALHDGLHDQPLTVTGAYMPYLREEGRSDEPTSGDSTRALHRVMQFRVLLYT